MSKQKQKNVTCIASGLEVTAKKLIIKFGTNFVSSKSRSFYQNPLKNITKR